MPDDKRSECNSFPNFNERLNLVHKDKNIKGGHGETGEGIKLRPASESHMYHLIAISTWALPN